MSDPADDPEREAAVLARAEAEVATRDRARIYTTADMRNLFDWHLELYGKGPPPIEAARARLHADRDDTVVAGFNRLRPRRPMGLITRMLETVPLAASVHLLPAVAAKEEADLRQLAAAARAVNAFAGDVRWNAGPAPEAIEKMADLAKAIPDRFHVTRKNKAAAAGETAALRYLAEYVRGGAAERFDLATVVRLVEAAIGRTISVNASHALRALK